MLSLPSPPPSRWRLPLALLCGVLLLLLWQYRATFTAMVGIWDRSGTFAHAYLVPPISLWLMWRLRGALAALSPRPQPWMLLPMALAGLAWLVGEIAGVNALTQLAATALLVLAVPAVLGTPVARTMLFPLCFLFFMVPTGEFVMPTLMDWTADVTVFVLRLCGIPVYREGLQFVIPSGNWSVVEACSGVRYLIASFMVGTLFAYLNYNSMKRRLAFVGVSLLVPIVANWARAVMIVMLGHFSGNRLAVGVDHLIYGWVFFGIVISIMFFIGARWSEPPAPARAVGTLPADTAADVGAAPWLAVAAVALVLCAPPLLAARLQSAPTSTPVLRLPDLAGIAADDAATPLHQPKFEGPRAQAVRVYGSGENAVTVHVAYYRQQTYGHKLVNSQNVLVDSEDKLWRRTERGSTDVTAGGRALTLRTAELRTGDLGGLRRAQRLQVRQLLWVNGEFTASDHRAALKGVLGQLGGQGDDGAAITFYLAGEDAVAVSRALDAFVATHLGSLSAWLDTVRAQR